MPAAPLAPQAARQSSQDLEVTRLRPDGTVTPPVYYTYAQLRTLPQTTLTVAADPTTHRAATYSGVYVRELLAALRTEAFTDAICLTCYDGYRQYYDNADLALHAPLFLLQYNGQPPGAWPKSDQNTPQGPYSVVYGAFQPFERIDGYVEAPRVPFGVVSAQLCRLAQALAPLAPLAHGDDPLVQKGEKIAQGACISCHGQGSAGGTLSPIRCATLGTLAADGADFFNGYVLHPRQYNPQSVMPPHPTYDEATLRDLRAYFRSLNPPVAK